MTIGNSFRSGSRGKGAGPRLHHVQQAAEISQALVMCIVVPCVFAARDGITRSSVRPASSLRTWLVAQALRVIARTSLWRVYSQRGTRKMWR